MKLTLRRGRSRTWIASLILGLLSSLTPFVTFPSALQSASAVAANPSPVCAGSTCTVEFQTTTDFYNWIVPAGVSEIIISASGASGGNGTTQGGLGAKIRATINVTSGETLKIFVGQQGFQGAISNISSYVSNSRLGGGGGGGTYVLRNVTTPLVVAGGGGGGQGPCCYSGLASYANYSGKNGSLSTSGTDGNTNSSAYGKGGTGGGGGTTGSNNSLLAGGGGGINGDGIDGAAAGQKGLGLPNGLTGGTANSNCNSSWGTGGNGGFGGGGAACSGAGGGGGGYSGGGSGGGSSHWSTRPGDWNYIGEL